MTMRGLGWLAAFAVLSLPVWAQDRLPAGPPGAPAPAAKQWTFYLSALGYVLPEGGSYVAPVLTSDRGKAHWEARYNYENQQTGSLWAGRNFSFGKTTTLDLTPMIGGVFGRSSGVAPGLRASIQRHRFSVDSEIEYLIEADRANSFFYSWTEVSYAPREWFRAGVVIQRTRAYQTEFDIQRGVLAGVSWKAVDFTTYILDPFAAESVTVFGAGIRF